MRALLLALPFATLLPLTAQAHEDHDHGSLAPHEHGVGQANLIVDGQTLEIELDGPAMNVLGFEHAASSAADKATLANAKARLEQPASLFELPAAAQCSVAHQAVESSLFGNAAADDDHDHDHDGHEHADIHTHYQFQCDNPQALDGIGFAPLFKAFPNTRSLNVQAITGSGQKALQATPDNSHLAF